MCALLLASNWGNQFQGCAIRKIPILILQFYIKNTKFHTHFLNFSPFLLIQQIYWGSSDELNYPSSFKELGGLVFLGILQN